MKTRDADDAPLRLRRPSIFLAQYVAEAPAEATRFFDAIRRGRRRRRGRR